MRRGTFRVAKVVSPELSAIFEPTPGTEPVIKIEGASPEDEWVCGAGCGYVVSHGNPSQQIGAGVYVRCPRCRAFNELHSAIAD